jgi:RNA polymerase sigma-70 factor (family 1)
LAFGGINGYIVTKIKSGMNGSSEMFEREKQFKLLFDRYKKPIHDYVRIITGSQEVAEEIAQEVFIRLWRRKGSYNEIEQIDYYIFRIARNECMRYFKKAAVETQLFLDLQKRMTAECNNITEYINYKETEAMLYQAIGSLSPRRHKVYQLSRHQGLRIEQIAAEMGISYNTARNHLVEALRQIRHHYLKNLSVSLIPILHVLLISSHLFIR